MPATYCGDVQLPPVATDELDATTDEATELDATLLGTEEEATELTDEEVVTPSHAPNSDHSCHWPE